jgi:hypothetical protein
MPSRAEFGYTLLIFECLLFASANAIFPNGGVDILRVVAIGHLAIVTAGGLLFVADRYRHHGFAEAACMFLYVVVSPVLVAWVIHKLVLVLIWIVFFSWRAKDSCCKGGGDV